MTIDPLTDWISMTRAWGVEALLHTCPEPRHITRPPTPGVAVTLLVQGSARQHHDGGDVALKSGEAFLLITGEEHRIEVFPEGDHAAKLLTISYEDSRCPVSSLWARRSSDFIHLDAETMRLVPGVSVLTDLLSEELLRQAPGMAPATGGMLDALMVMLLRAAMKTSSTGVWLHGMDDPVIRDALRAIHAEPAQSWTLQELARHVGVSRSSLARRFTEELGESAMSYVRRWRMSLAARQLITSEATLDEIAQQVGYESTHAFSRAFKNVFGDPPGQFRSAYRQTYRPLNHPLHLQEQHRTTLE